MDAPQDAVCIERAEVEAVVRDVDDLIKGCGNTLHEVFASVPVFYEQNTRLCVAISRNLLTLHETLPIIRFLSSTTQGLLDELSESLSLCLAFLQEYAVSCGFEEREIDPAEESEIMNKLAFMNKLLHLNQHSLNIRLLMEAADHSRIAHEHAQQDAEEQAKAALRTRSQSVSVLQPHRQHKRMVQLAYGRPHRQQFVYGPIRAPVNFVPETRVKEWKLIQGTVKTFPRDRPCMLFVTGPPGIGKSAYARYVAHKMHSYLDFHVLINCAQPDALGGVADCETLMRACLAPQQLEGLAPMEVQRAFRAVTWQRRGIMLLDNVQSEAQVAAMLPNRGKCFVIVTSTRPLSGLLKPEPQVNKLHQILEPLSNAGSEPILSHEHYPVETEHCVALNELVRGIPVSLDLLSHQTPLQTPESIIDELNAEPSRRESRVLSLAVHAIAAIDTSRPVSRSPESDELIELRAYGVARVIYRAYADLLAESRTIFAALHIFPSHFDTRACMSILSMEPQVFAEAMTPLLASGLVREWHASSKMPLRVRRHGSASSATSGQVIGGAGSTPGNPDEEVGGRHPPPQPITANSRFWVHDSVRQFSQAVAAANPRLADVVSSITPRFAEHFRDVLVGIDENIASSSNQKYAQGFRDFDKERENILTAISLALSGSVTDDAVKMDLLLPRKVYQLRLSDATRARIYQHCLDQLGSVRDEQRLRTLMALAQALASTNQFEQSIPLFKKCQKVASKMNRTDYVSKALLGLARVSELLGEHEIALDYCARCRSVLEAQGDKKLLGELLLHIVDVYDAMGDYQSCIAVAEEAVACAREAESPEVHCKAAYAQGFAHLRAEQHEEAVKHLEVSASEAQQIGDLKVLAQSIKGLHTAHEHLNHFYKAHCYHEKLSHLLNHSDIPLF